jgi:AhpD family alkylhydroperoxidase
MVSQAAGCRYCIAHTGAFAVERGVNETKLKAIFEFETSSLFTAAERAALKVARGAGVIPNGVNDEEFRQLRTHFGDEQVVEMISVIAFYGFLNRWNDTIATELESTPTQFASEHLAAQGWKLGKHARENS